MRKLILLMMLALTGCGGSIAADAQRYKGEVKVTAYVGGDSYVTRFYDSEMKVWCWKSGVNQGGLSCIPEWQLEDPYSRVDPNEDPINGGE